MEPSETKSGNSIEIITGTEIGYIGTQKIYQKYNKLELIRKRRTVETCGVCNRKFRKQKKVRNHIRLAHDSQAQKLLKIKHSNDK